MAEKNKKQFKQQLLGDIEYAAEVLRKIKKQIPEENIDLGVRVGLDAYAFDQGKLSKEEFKEKLLKIKNDPRRMGVKMGNNLFKETRGAYDSTDSITLYKGSEAYERELTPDPEGGRSYKSTPRSEEAGRFMIAVHEIKHRGNALLNSLGLIDYNVDRHSDTDYDDSKLRDKLNIRHTQPKYEKQGDEKRSKTRKKKIKKIYKKSKALQDRYPGAYNRGGKVYSNQPRKVRV